MSEAPASPPRRFRPDGQLDVVRRGHTRRPLGHDLYHFLRRTRWSALLGLIAGFYLAVNLVFATLYGLSGWPWPEASTLTGARPGSFVDAFFFSVQTLSTIGYGGMVPKGALANGLVTIEALVGLLMTAMATGLIFAKFATPTARVLFSRVALITEHAGQRVLTFRLANERVNQIVEAQVRVSLLRRVVTAEGTMVRFFDLKLQRDSSPVFAMTWSVFHTIDADSPMADLTDAQHFIAEDAALVVTMTGIDDSLAQHVHARHAYEVEDLVWDRLFADVVEIRPDGQRIFDLTRFHDTIPRPR